MPQIKEWTEEIFAQLRSQSITLRSKGPHVYSENSRKLEADAERKADNQSESSLEEENQSDDALKEETRIQLEHEAWIQCDKCSKWRRVAKEVATEYADKDWLCSLNTDSKHNSCIDAEETHDERKARKYGLRYVCSEIAVGSLVWARLDGFARWPAVLTPDPENGEHTKVDEDGDVSWYHVEFLGSKPSHSWCNYRRVEVYGKKDATTNVAQVAESKTRKKGRKYPRLAAPKASQTLQQRNLNTALKEADHLVSLTNQQRLQRCHFKWSPKTTEDSENGSSKELKDYRAKTSPAVESTCCKKMSTEMRMRSTGKKGTSLKRNRQTENAGSGNDKQKNMHVSGTELQSSAPSVLPPDLGTCTEKDFGMMVSAFMTSHGKHVSSPPVWNGSKVSLHQLFTAVMEKGGYSQLTKRGKAGGWSGIYRLLAKCSMTSHGGQAARKYYERNLLPYEMFLSGCSVEEIQQVMKKPLCQPNSTSAPTTCTEQHLLGDDPTEDTLDDEMLKMEDMENILISLDESIKTDMYDAKSDTGSMNQTGAAPLLKFYSNMYEDEPSADYEVASSSLMEVDADMSFLPAVEVGVPAAEVERHEDSMMEELEAMQVDLDELNTSLGQELLEL